jgi:hypothetical protein
MFVCRFSFEGENYTANYGGLIRRCAMPRRKARVKTASENRKRERKEEGQEEARRGEGEARVVR